MGSCPGGTHPSGNSPARRGPSVFCQLRALPGLIILCRFAQGSLKDQLERLPRLLPPDAPDEEVDGRVRSAVDRGQEDTDVVESLVVHLRDEEPDDARGQATEEEHQDGEQDNQVEPPGLMLVDALPHTPEQQQAGRAHDGEQERGPRAGDGCERRAGLGGVGQQLAAGVASQYIHQKGQNPEQGAHDGRQVLGTVTAIPNRELGGQATLKADGGHDTQASEIEEEPSDHDDSREAEAVIKEKLQDLAERVHDLETKVHEIRNGEIEAVDREGVFPDGQTDKPNDDSVSRQPAERHGHRDGAEERLAGVARPRGRPSGAIGGVFECLAELVHDGRAERRSARAGSSGLWVLGTPAGAKAGQALSRCGGGGEGSTRSQPLVGGRRGTQLS